MRHKKLISAQTSPFLWEDLIKTKGHFTTATLSNASVNHLLSQQPNRFSAEQKLFSKDVYSVFLIAASEVSEAFLVESAETIKKNAPEPLSFVISTNATSGRKMICFFPEGVSKGNVFKLIPPDKWGATVSLGDDMATVHGNDHSLIQNPLIQPEDLFRWHNLSLPNTHIENVLSQYLPNPLVKVLISDNDGTLVGINEKAPTPQTFAFLRTFLERADSEIHIVTGSSIRVLEMYLKFILSLTEAQSEKLTFHCLNRPLDAGTKMTKEEWKRLTPEQKLEIKKAREKITIPSPPIYGAVMDSFWLMETVTGEWLIPTHENMIVLEAGLGLENHLNSRETLTNFIASLEEE